MKEQPEALRLAELVDHGSDSTLLEEEVAAELRRLHAENGELLEALKNLEKEFRRIYLIYYCAEPWGHETNVPLQAARAAIARAKGEKQ